MFDKEYNAEGLKDGKRGLLAFGRNSTTAVGMRVSKGFGALHQDPCFHSKILFQCHQLVLGVYSIQYVQYFVHRHEGRLPFDLLGFLYF